MSSPEQFAIGWSQVDLTPDEPVFLAGQFHARVSEGVLDPIGATALALRSPDGEHVVFVSLDLVTVAENLRDAVRSLVTAPGLDPRRIVFNATHTHAGPDTRVSDRTAAHVSRELGLDLGAMGPAEYVASVAPRLAAMIDEAWSRLAPGAVAFGLGHAVVGHNRRWVARDGAATMYGNTASPAFSHIEGYEDHSVHVLATWDPAGRLTGLVVNLACPSQVSEHIYQVSADYWHDTREELRRRLGADLFILGQCAPAGDQSPHHIVAKRAEQRMMELHGRSERQEIAVRIADAVERVVPAIRPTAEAAPVLRHVVTDLDLLRRPLSRADVDEALAGAADYRARYEQELAKLEADPSLREQPRWYVPVTQVFRRMQWFAAVEARYELQQTEPYLAVELHALRICDLAVATSPFEFYLDYGTAIVARSPAVQTMQVQISGSGSYLPTARAMAGGSYGALPASTQVGAEAGQQIVDWAVETLTELW